MEADDISTTPVTPPPKKGIPRLIAATRYSMSGLRSAFTSEEAVRLETAAIIILVPIALWLGNNPVEKLLLAGSIILVLIVELLNTAVEYVVDRVGRDYHELSRDAKDIGSAAVLVAMLLGFFTWALLLIPW